MAEKSGFFNALYVDGDYDRKYNANDYTDSLAVVISSGVLRSGNDDLKVTASGMVATVAAGWGWIKGHYYHNDSPLALAPVTAPTGGSRYDRVMLRFDNTLTQRRIYVIYVQGTASNSPVPPAPTRTTTVYDLVLADLYITANATSMIVIDKRPDSNVCGWVYSTSGDGSFFESLDNSFWPWFEEKKDTLASVTLFKRYSWVHTMSAAGSSVSFQIPQYNPDTCFIEVYVNGILENRYSLNSNVITFVGTLVAGTVVTVNCYKSIDGTGIQTVADEITELQTQVAALSGVSTFAYKCTGLNDNIALSEIAQAFLTGSYVAASVTDAAKNFLEALGGNTFLAALDASAQVEIDVVGELDARTPYNGSGSSVSPYVWFSLGGTTTTTKRLQFNFSKCSRIYIYASSNTSNVIFGGNDLYIKAANVWVTGQAANTNITMIKCNANTGVVNFSDCWLRADASGAALIAEHGTFTNCYCYVGSDASTAYCFKPRSTGLIRLMGGKYFAYGLTSSGIGSAIMHTSAGDTDAVLLAYNIHCPVVTVQGYSQGFLSVANAGSTYINGVVSRLTSSGSYNEIVAQVNKNKA